MTFLQVLTFVVVAVTPSPSESCGAVSKHLLDEPRLRFSETYANETWGYAITIPPGMTAYSQTAPPYHGVWFVLGDPAHGAIVVEGQANSLEFKDPQAAARSQLRFLSDGKTVGSNSLTAIRWGSLPAVRMETRYRCKGDPAMYAEVYVVALGPEKDPMYEIVLTTTVDRLREDRAILERILRSWKFIGR
jgi:hypothetical protein